MNARLAFRLGGLIWLRAAGARAKVIVSQALRSCSNFDFAQFARVHVENDAADGDVFGNPGMRPDFLDLLPGICLGVLIGEESHWSRRRIAGGSAQLGVQFGICECREPAAGVVEEQYLG